MSKTLIPPREWQEAIGQLRLLPDGDCKIILTREPRHAEVIDRERERVRGVFHRNPSHAEGPGQAGIDWRHVSTNRSVASAK